MGIMPGPLGAAAGARRSPPPSPCTFVAETGVRATPAGGPAIRRVVRISPRHEVSVAVDGLPFTALPAHGDAGAADVAIVSGTLLVLTGEGSSAISRSVLRALPDGSV